MDTDTIVLLLSIYLIFCQFQSDIAYKSVAYKNKARTFHYVYYLKYTELKSFFGYHVWAPKPVYQLLNPSG